MTTWVLLIALGLAPVLALRRVSAHAFAAVRDHALLVGLGLTAVWLLQVEPLFAPLAVWFLLVWPRPAWLPARHAPRVAHELLGPLVAWIAIAALWFAVRAVPSDRLELLPLAWVPWACVQGPIVSAQRFGWLRCATPQEAGATFGQRTLCAAFLASAAPFAPWWAWPWLAWGLLVTSSWGAWAALAAGMIVLFPRAAPWLALAAAGLALVALGWPRPWNPLRRALNALPRGASLDSLVQRWRLWCLMARHWRVAWPWGTGPDSMSRWARRWQVAYRTPLPLGEAHCEPAQLAWEYGVAGALTVALVAWRVGEGLRWGDPWSAAAVVAGVLCLGTCPLRVAPLGIPILVIWARVAP